MHQAASALRLVVPSLLLGVGGVAEVEPWMEKEVEWVASGEPIVRNDFENCQPAGAVLVDERQPDHWVLRTKDWPGKMMNAIGHPPDLTYDPQLKGRYDIYLGLRSVNAVMSVGVKLSSEAGFTTVTAPMSGVNDHYDLEFCWKRDVALDGETILLRALGETVYLGYLKFVPRVLVKRTHRVATDHVVIGQEAGAHLAFPGVVRLQSGEVLAVFREGTGHVDPSGKIVLCRSLDGGRTWGPRRVIYDDPDVDERDPGIFQHTSGTVIVSFASQGSKIMRSEDGGQTWDKPTPAPVFTPHGPRELPDGRLYYCGIRTERGINHVDLVTSEDLGRTWQPWTNIALSLPWHQPMVKEFYDEPFALPVSETRWLCLHRVDLNGYLYQSVSEDGGSTWSDVPQRTEMWGHPAHLLRLRDGRVLCTYGYRREPFGIRACLSQDGGRSWDVAHELILRCDGVHGDLGYPTAIELDDGVVLAVYYFNDQEHPGCYIAGTFFRP